MQSYFTKHFFELVLFYLKILYQQIYRELGTWTQTYKEPCQISKMKPFAKIVNH